MGLLGWPTLKLLIYVVLFREVLRVWKWGVKGLFSCLGLVGLFEGQDIILRNEFFYVCVMCCSRLDIIA